MCHVQNVRMCVRNGITRTRAARTPPPLSGCGNPPTGIGHEEMPGKDWTARITRWIVAGICCRFHTGEALAAAPAARPVALGRAGP